MEYFVVLSPNTNSNHSLQHYKTLLDNYKDVQSYCLSFEVSDDGHQHYHLYIKATAKQETLRNRFARNFNATARFSSKDIQSRVRTIAYTIKDGNYVQKNLNVADFLMACQVTHPKPKKFEVQMRDNDEEYIAGNISKEDYIDNILKIYVNCRRKTYIQHITSHAITVHMEASSDYRKQVRDKILQELYFL